MTQDSIRLALIPLATARETPDLRKWACRGAAAAGVFPLQPFVDMGPLPVLPAWRDMDGWRKCLKAAIPESLPGRLEFFGRGPLGILVGVPGVFSLSGMGAVRDDLMPGGSLVIGMGAPATAPNAVVTFREPVRTPLRWSLACMILRETACGKGWAFRQSMAMELPLHRGSYWS